MRLVGVAHDLCGATGERGAEDGFAERRLGGARAEIVRRAADGDLDAAGVVRVEEFGGHRGPGGGLGRGRLRLHGFDEVPAAGGAVGVEVVEHDEAGTGGLGPGEHAALQRRELLGPPAVVGGVQAEVDDVGARGDPGGERRVGGVAGDELGAGDGAAAAAVHGDDVVAEGDQLFDDEAADLAGAEDDVAGHDALRCCCRVRSERAGRRSGR